jgi:hypothetical protein
MRPGVLPPTGGSVAPASGPVGGRGASIGGAPAVVANQWVVGEPTGLPHTPHRQAWWRVEDQMGWWEGPATRAALARSERHLRAFGFGRVGGNVGAGARVGIVEWNRRSGRAYEVGHCVRWNGHTRRGYCDKCPGHSDFRHRAADTRGYGPAHLSLLWCGPIKATLPSAVLTPPQIVASLLPARSGTGVTQLQATQALQVRGVCRTAVAVRECVQIAQPRAGRDRGSRSQEDACEEGG